MNIEINEQEYETLIDLCLLSLIVVYHSGNQSEQELRMQSLYNKILSLRSHQYTENETNLRMDRLEFTFFNPCIENQTRQTSLPVANSVSNELVVIPEENVQTYNPSTRINWI